MGRLRWIAASMVARGYMDCTQTRQLEGYSAIKGGLGAAVHNALVSEIQRLLRQECTIKVSHVYLEGNWVADALVATAFRQPLGLVLLQQPPDEVAQALHDDVLGIGQIRLVAV